ncbi:MAG: tRNA lysidine(34) synthetase TilS [Rhodospirillales bacterium]
MSASALTPEGFAARMARLGPFEPAPRVGVGVSGGPDSLALCLLLDRWTRDRGGSVLALTVDHGLRAAAAGEAAAVGAFCAARGIPHRVLRVAGPAPDAGLQAWARRARHALLEAACEAEGILHLALAHHADDQGETLLLRLARGSGPDGLAGMGALRETGAVRLVRPLLGVPRAALAAVCAEAGVGWVADPSNDDPRFARARLRAVAPHLAAEGLSGASLAAVAARAGRVRAFVEGATADLLARAATVHEAGFVRLDPACLRTADREIARRALAAALAVVGAADRPAREAAVDRMLDLAVGDGAAPGTLAGARVLRWRGAIVVCREPAAMAGPRDVTAAGPSLWDHRFRITPAGPTGGLSVGAAGPGGPARDRPEARALPGPVRAALPALRLHGTTVAVPHLGWWSPAAEAAGLRGTVVTFAPRVALSAAPFRTAEDVV